MDLPGVGRRSLVAVAILVGSMLPWMLTTHAGSTVACERVVSPGDSISTALREAPPGATVCISTGTYPIQTVLRPKAHQTIRGTGFPKPIITCGTAYCFDGISGSGHVSLIRLTLQGASDADIRAGRNWVIQSVEARFAAVAGIAVRESNVSIIDSYVHHNGKVGINAASVSDLLVVGTQVAFNPTDPSFGTGFSAGLKLNGTDGSILQDNYVHDNGGGAGIWLDIDSRNFEMIGNRVVGNVKDGIRIEISCDGTLDSNLVEGSGGTGIDLFNSHRIDVRSNTVSSPNGSVASIRMLGTGRTTSTGSGLCRNGGGYDNVNNVATANSITMTDRSALVGIMSTGGPTSGDSWSATTYVVPDCSGLQWRWWTGASNRKIAFADWQAFGQDLSGTCS